MGGKSRILACVMTCAIGIMITGCSTGNSTREEENVIDSSKVTLITKVLPLSKGRVLFHKNMNLLNFLIHVIMQKESIIYKYWDTCYNVVSN